MGVRVEVLRYADLAAAVLGRPARLGGVRLVAVDGPSGGGKTTFAARLAGAVRAAGASVAVVNTDDLLDGWDDMLTFWPRLERWVLEPLRAGRPGAYRRYDWYAGAFGSGWQPVPVSDVLVLEGVTSARRVIRAELTFLVWVTAPREVRFGRSLARDGEHTRDALLAWTRAEDTHFAAEGTESAAEVVINGVATELLSDPDTEVLGVISGSTDLTHWGSIRRDNPPGGKGRLLP
jgi:uridine kinase